MPDTVFGGGESAKVLPALKSLKELQYSGKTCSISYATLGNFTSPRLLFFFLINLFWLHWVFVAVRRAFSSCGERGLLFVALHRLLITVASLVVCRAQALGAWASVVVACRLSSCGSRALERSLSSCGARA